MNVMNHVNIRDVNFEPVEPALGPKLGLAGLKRCMGLAVIGLCRANARPKISEQLSE